MKVLLENESGEKVLNTIIKGKAHACTCVHVLPIQSAWPAEWYRCSEICPLFGYNADTKELRLCHGVVHNDVTVHGYEA